MIGYCPFDAVDCQFSRTRSLNAKGVWHPVLRRSWTGHLFAELKRGRLHRVHHLDNDWGSTVTVRSGAGT